MPGLLQGARPPLRKTTLAELCRQFDGYRWYCPAAHHDMRGNRAALLDNTGDTGDLHCAKCSR